MRNIAILLTAMTLVACGGGGDAQTPPVSTAPSPAPAPPAPTNPPPAPDPAPAPTPPTETAPPNNGAAADYINFETVPTRAFAKSGKQLFVTNPRNNHVDVFDISAETPVLTTSIAVGMEPIALAVQDNNLWVVNHLSDSVSIIDITNETLHVSRTLLVGDEPRDIVFADNKAFITTAHRGQHRTHSSIADIQGSGDPQTHTASIGRADIWVFDPSNLGTALGGKPVKIIELFGDTPRGLAVSPDGKSVYAAVFNSGNQTTVIHEAVMCYGFTDDDPNAEYSGARPCYIRDGINSPNGLADAGLPGGRPAPGWNKDGIPQPWTSMIVKYDGESGQWRDTLGRNFSNGVRFNLPDQDVFQISTETLSLTRSYPHVGTTLFNMVVNPQTGNVYVTNTDSSNHIRFEGPGQHGGSTVQGQIAKARISTLTGDGVNVQHLNTHIDYAQLKAPASVKQASVATPLDMAITHDGNTLFVAALGSNKVAVYNTANLEGDFDPVQAANNHIPVTGGPAGLWLDEEANRLYVLTHFDHALVTLNATTGAELSRLPLISPEPEAIAEGRFMLYDANRSSSNGEASCASCHVFGDMDHLSWNLGNPDESNSADPQPQPTANLTRLSCDLIGPDDPLCTFLEIVNGNGKLDEFASMKGPMNTQTLRGMSTHGHMHWRGDRANGYFGIDTEQTLDERLSFKNFIVAFDGLLGMDIDLPDSSSAGTKSDAVVALENDMEKFTNFALSLQMPPNPHKGLDNTHSTTGQTGRNFFNGTRRGDGAADDTNANGPEPDGVNCAGCHELDPAKGFYGTNGGVSHGGEILMLKTPQLRNLYQKVGMFGLPDRENFLPSTTREHQGDQIRGFGFLHDGATDKLFNFLQGAVFDNGEEGCPPGIDASHGCELNFGPIGIQDDNMRQSIVDYLMEFDTDLAPIVGQQITLSKALFTEDMQLRVEMLEERAGTQFISKTLGGTVTECDLVAKGIVAGEVRGYLFNAADHTYTPDKADQAPVSSADMRTLSQTAENVLTFTCTPPGSGRRMAIDEDRDGVLNGDEEK